VRSETTSGSQRAAPCWLPYIDLACAFTAGGLWYASSHAWPLLIAVAPWAIRFALTRRLTRRTPFDVPLALFLLTAVVGVWVAFDRQPAWARFWLILGGVFIFYALANAESGGSLAKVQARCSSDLRVWFLALLGAAAAIVFVLTNDWQSSAIKIGFLTHLGEALQAPLPRLPGPEVNANIAGAILAMLLPFAGLATVQAWQGLRAAAGFRRIRAGLAFALGLASLSLVVFGWIMTASRGAWAAVLGALLLAGVWLVAGRLSRGSPARRGLILAGCLALGLVAIVVVAAARPGAMAALVNALPGPSAVGSRTELWRNSLILVQDYPFTGLGLDGFMMAYASYVMLLHVGFAPHAHNLYLDLAIEQGVPALLLLLAMSVLFFRAFWREQTGSAMPERSRSSPAQSARCSTERATKVLRKGQMAAAALSLLVILLHGLVDDPLYKSRAVLFLFVPLAFASSVAEAQKQPNAAHPAGDARHSTGVRCVWLALAACAVLTLALLWRNPLLSLVASNRAAVLQSRAELSGYTWPEWPIQDEVRRHVDLGLVVALYEGALAFNPGNATANRRLGQIELSLGQYEEALGHLQAAYAAEPWSQTTRQLLGEAYLANGRLEEGRALWAGVSNQEAQLDIRVWWYEHIGEQERAEWMRQAASQR
jgi:hypothetical protein